MLLFFDKFIKNTSPKEAKIKEDIKHIQDTISFLDEEIDITTVNKDMAYEEIAANPSEKETIMCTIKDLTTKLRTITDRKKKNSAELRQLKDELVRERKLRNGDENGMENLLLKVLEKQKIKKQHFHGGAMNGVCCRRLLDNVDAIFEDIETIKSERVRN